MPLLTTFGAASLYGYTSASRTDPFLVTTAFSSASTVTIPSSAAVGDVAVLFDTASNAITPAPASVVPSGWTSVNDTAGAVSRVISSYKLLVGGDPGATITGMNGFFQSKSLLIFRKTVVATAVSAFSAAGQNTTGDPTAQVVTSSGGVVPIIVIATYYSSGGTVTGESFTPTATGAFSGSNFSSVLYKVFQASPVDVTVDIGNISGDTALQSYYLQIS